MNTKTTTPPRISRTSKAIFPLFENDWDIISNLLANGYNISVYKQFNFFIVSGDENTIEEAMMVFVGGMRA